jgi:hypothetical protein
VLDRERILAKIDELEGYLHDLRTIAPASFDDPDFRQMLQHNPRSDVTRTYCYSM